jgi:hypothetical protein
MARALDHRRRYVLAPEDVQGIGDGRHGIAQLVRECREEFVLAAIGGLHFRVQPRALGHVAEHEHASENHAIGEPDRRGAVVDRALAAIARDQHRVVGEAHDHSIAQRPHGRVLHFLAGVFVHDVEDARQVQAARFGGGPAGEGLGDGVEEGNPAVPIGGDDAIADAGERRLQELALLRDLERRALACGEVAAQEHEERDEDGRGEQASDDRRGERASVGVGRFDLARGEQLVFARPHLRRDGADLAHLGHADIGHHDIARRIEAVFAAQLHRALELADLQLHVAAKVRDGCDLGRVVGDQVPQGRERGLDAAQRGTVRVEVALVAGDEVAALAGLRVPHEGKDRFQRAPDRPGMHDPLRLRAQALDVRGVERDVRRKEDEQEHPAQDNPAFSVFRHGKS